MIFIWKGRGILSIVLLFVTFFILLFTLSNEDSTYGFAIPFLVSGIFSFVFGNKWNSTKKLYIDPKSGKKVVLTNQHTLFWINMEYWGLVFIVFGTGLIFEQSLINSLVIGGILLAAFIFYKYQKNSKTSLPLEELQNRHVATNSIDIKEEKKVPVEQIEVEENTISIDKEDHSRFMPS